MNNARAGRLTNDNPPLPSQALRARPPREKKVGVGVRFLVLGLNPSQRGGFYGRFGVYLRVASSREIMGP